MCENNELRYFRNSWMISARNVCMCMYICQMLCSDKTLCGIVLTLSMQISSRQIDACMGNACMGNKFLQSAVLFQNQINLLGCFGSTTVFVYSKNRYFFGVTSTRCIDYIFLLCQQCLNSATLVFLKLSARTLDAQSPVLPFQPNYRWGHPEN